MNISVIGTGYVGLVSGVCLAQTGHQVACLDVDQSKLNALADGVVPYYEPGLEKLLVNGLEKGRLTFSSSFKGVLSNAQVVIVAVGTPSEPSGQVNLDQVFSVAWEIGQIIERDLVVVLKSTVPVGTTKKVGVLIQSGLEKRGIKGRIQVEVVSNPEFLKEGNAIQDFTHPDRIIVGCSSEKSKRVLEELYSPYLRLGHGMIFMEPDAAEFTKYVSNAFLATKVSFMNEMSMLAEELSVDIEQVKQGVGADERIGYHHIHPGVGYGGSCFPKDVRALISEGSRCDLQMDLISAVEKVNKKQKSHFLNKIKDAFSGHLSGKRLAVWGLSFKPDTDDVREAPSLEIVNGLLRLGAHVVVHDPVAIKSFRNSFQNEYVDRLSFEEDPYEALRGVSGLALLTEWTSFMAPDFERMRSLMAQPRIFDGRNQYNPNSLRDKGFAYHSVGRPKTMD